MVILGICRQSFQKILRNFAYENTKSVVQTFGFAPRVALTKIQQYGSAICAAYGEIVIVCRK